MTNEKVHALPEKFEDVSSIDEFLEKILESREYPQPPRIMVKIYPDIVSIFGFKIIECYFIDTIRILSSHTAPKPGWCNMSKKHLAEYLQMSERAVFNMIKKLLKDRWLKKSAATNYLRPSELYIKAFEKVDKEKKKYFEEKRKEYYNRKKRKGSI